MRWGLAWTFDDAIKFPVSCHLLSHLLMCFVAFIANIKETQIKLLP